MKKRIIIYLFLFSFLTSIESAVTKNKINQNKNLGYLKVKYDKKLNEYSSFKNSNYDTSILKEERFIIPAKINYFFYDLIANLENQSLEGKNDFTSVDIDSDKQTAQGSKILAEGNVIITTNNSVLSCDKFSYDKDLKIMIIEGNIKFKSENSYLEASNIKYDFKNSKGYILNAYGSIDFQNLSKISVSTKSNNAVDEDFNDFKEPKEVKFGNASNIKLGNIFRKYDEKQSFAKRLINQALEVNFNSVVNTRFISKKININDDIWFSESLTITNDPYTLSLKFFFLLNLDEL